MPCLLDFQRELRDAIFAADPQAAPASVRAVCGNAAQRLDVYRNTIESACTRALGLTFPTVVRLVGNEFFEGAAQVFAWRQGPDIADLNAYGAGFPDFVQGFAPCASLKYLPDVARLDWAISRALDAPDVHPLAPDALAGMGEAAAATLRLCFHPSVSLLGSGFPVDEIWHAVLAQDDDAMARVNLASGPLQLLIERDGDGARVHRLSQPQSRFAMALLAGRELGQLCEEFEASELPVLLAQQLAHGRLIAVTNNPAGQGP